MAVGSGIGGQFGFSAESVYGTYVAPTRFLRANKAEVKKVKNVVQGGGLAAGQLVESGGQRVVATEAGTGAVEFEVPTTKLGLLLQHIFGSSATPSQQAATAAYLQTHVLGDNAGKFLTMQTGVPQRDGTVKPMSGLGGKITSAEFSCKVGELLTCNLDADFRQVVTSQALATASYTAAVPFAWPHLAVKIGTHGAEAAVDGVKGVSLKIERGQDTEAFYANNAGLKDEPVSNEFVRISGSLDVDFVTQADFVDKFHSDSDTSLVLEWTHPTAIESTYYPLLRFTLPMTFFDGDTPGLEGPDVNRISVPFVAQFDDTNAVITCEYQSTDTSV